MDIAICMSIGTFEHSKIPFESHIVVVFNITILDSSRQYNYLLEMKFSEVSKELNKYYKKVKEKENASLHGCSSESPYVTRKYLLKLITQI